MGNNKEEILLNLMQNVSDKLDEIYGKVSQENDVKSEDGLLFEIPQKQEQLIEASKKIFQNQRIIHNQLIEVVKDIKTNKPIITDNQRTEYSVFGKDSPFSSKLLLSVIIVILISSFGFKYVPDYLNERSEIKTERDNYKLFYEYVFLNAFDKRNKVPTDILETMREIKVKDSSFLNYVNHLNKKYTKQIKKKALEEELNKLQ